MVALVMEKLVRNLFPTWGMDNYIVLNPHHYTTVEIMNCISAHDKDEI